MEYPQTVEGIVAELKRRGERFQVRDGLIRSRDRRNRAGCLSCPIEVLAGQWYIPGVPDKVVNAVMDAADEDRPTAVRTQLLTLCEEA